MRISILCGGTRVFGLEIMALTIAQGLQAKGHQVECLISGWNDGEFSDRLRAAKVPFSTVYFGKLSKSLTPRSLWYTFDALRHWPGARHTLTAHLREFRPDILLLYHRDWVLQARGMLHNQRSIFHVHELSTSSRLNALLYRALMHQVSAFAVVSQYIGDRLRAMGVSADKTHLVYNGVETVGDCEKRARSETPTIGIVGQIGPWKGHDDLVDALRILRDRGLNFRCRVIGRGDAQYIAALKEKVHRYGISDRIIWDGYVRDTRSLYSEMDICAVPSRFDEPFGLVAVEAALHGIAVVAARRGGLPEIVVDGETGLLVDAQRHDQLADRLESLLRDSSLRTRLGAAARVRARERFSATRMVDTMEALCSRVAEGNSTQIHKSGVR